MMRSMLPLLAFIVLLGAAASPAFAGDVRVVVNFKGHGQASAAIVESAGGRVHRTLHDAVAADLSPDAIARLRADPRVASVEEDGIVEVCAPPEGKGKPSADPEPEPDQVMPWGVVRVGGANASNTGTGIKVAVIDTGIDLKHPDLHVAGNVSFVPRTGTGKDDHGHGTHVSGSIAALDNDVGVIGVAPDALLYAVKVLDRRGRGYMSDVAAGIDWARVNGMHVANMSLGGGGAAVLRIACQKAFDNGVLLVAAAGNSGDGHLGTDEWSWPAAYASVVAVGATWSNDAFASFSNSGPYLEVSAPGVNVLSTQKGGGYGVKSGTSMASPHAAGVAALLWSELVAPSDPALAVANVRAALSSRVDNLEPHQGNWEHEDGSGWDPAYGYGIVNYLAGQ